MRGEERRGESAKQTKEEVNKGGMSNAQWKCACMLRGAPEQATKKEERRRTGVWCYLAFANQRDVILVAPNWKPLYHT